MHIEMETFDLTEVAAEVLKETGMIDQTHTFSARWEGAVPVCADVGLTKQALRILVDNSIKYTPAGGHITLSAALRDGMARLSVQDEGQGIDAGSLPHVFDRFYRTDQSRARQTGGTGLGLAIAKWIVDRHGGWFEVRSWPGVGTRMTIVLPVAELDAGGADEDAEQTRPGVKESPWKAGPLQGRGRPSFFTNLGNFFPPSAVQESEYHKTNKGAYPYEPTFSRPGPGRDAVPEPAGRLRQQQGARPGELGPRGGVPLRLPGGVPVPRPAHRQPGGPPRDHAPRGGDSLPGSLRRTQRQTLRPGRHPQAHAEADFHAYP